MTKSERKLIEENARAFAANFGPVRIEKEYEGSGYYVYVGDSDTYIQYCYNIHYLNGWLYGAVQGKLRLELTKESEAELNGR